MMTPEPPRFTGSNLSSSTTESSVTTESNIRKRRTGGRPDPLAYLAAFFASQTRAQTTHVHEVLCYSIWLSLIVFHIGNKTPKYFNRSSTHPHFAHRMRRCLHEDAIRLADDLKDAVYKRQAKERIMSYVKSMSVERALEFLDNCQVSRFYTDAISNQVIFANRFLQLSQVSSLDYPDLYYKSDMALKYDESWMSELTNPDMCGVLATVNEDRLLFLLDILRGLRESISVAAQNSGLNADLLGKIKIQLQEFDRRSLYSEACSTVAWKSPQEPFLVHPDLDQWWTLDSTMKNGTRVPENAVTAYPVGEKIRSTLTFVVPTVCLLAFIPAAMAWKHGDSTTGGTKDSNFWQILSGSIMQLLGLVTFIWPTLSSPRLSQLTWIWIWVLAGFSAVCAVVSVPLYLVSPTIWSFVVSFAGVLAQAVVQLQVINAIGVFDLSVSTS